MKRKFPNLSNSEVRILIDEWVSNERNRAILKRRLIDGVRYEMLAEEFGLSVQHTKNIVAKSEQELFKRIKMEK